MTTADHMFRARVTAVHKSRWEIDPGGSAVLAGAFIPDPADLPVVGDWVIAESHGTLCRIVEVEPRRGLLARKRPGDSEHDAVVEQPLAANIDLALLTMAVDDDFSMRRLERYLTLAWDSGATPLVVLTKSDLADTARLVRLTAEVGSVAFGSQCIETSSHTGAGLERVRAVLTPGTVAVLLGSSGVGKSSLLNALAGEDLQAVTGVREFDGKGRHTTTTRRLVELPWGAYLVDTPGLRELQLWGDEDSLASSFPDVEEIAAHCRFNDCRHEGEPECAVARAALTGELPADRLESWRRLRRELAHLARKTDPVAARAERNKWRSIAKSRRTLNRDRP
ncbi:MAG: ribosome small subunit-dependent GTPase A [Candidatus Nanopelagicales bacterium]